MNATKKAEFGRIHQALVGEADKILKEPTSEENAKRAKTIMDLSYRLKQIVNEDEPPPHVHSTVVHTGQP